MTDATQEFDVVILGAGAAALMCAVTAGQRGRRVLVLEHTNKAGAKILISGGGRCNFTNTGCDAAFFLSGNPHFAKSALNRYTPADFITLVERHGISYHEKTLGQLFCNGSARQIVAMLLEECREAGVDLRLDHTVTNVSKAESFRIETAKGCFITSKLVLATGGLSIPKMGATGFSLALAKRFGLRVTETRPGLVPLRLTVGQGFDPELAGVSLDATASCGGQSFRENILFTHRGLSGPAILQASSYWRDGAPVAIDLLPGIEMFGFLAERKLSRPKASLQTVLSEILPSRLAHTLSGTWPVSGEIANIPDKVLLDTALRLKNWLICPLDTEGYAKAEVMTGGIDTRDLSSKTMEAHSVSGLFAIGEAVDVTGWLGGYNFQWAWSSGWAAGQAL